MHPYSRRHHLGRLQPSRVGDRYKRYHWLECHMNMYAAVHLRFKSSSCFYYMLNVSQLKLGLFICETNMFPFLQNNSRLPRMRPRE